MKALVYQGKVLQIDAQFFEVHPNYQWIECDDSIKPGYLYQDGQFSPPPEQVLSADDQLNIYRQAIQEHLDRKSFERGYSGSISLVSYSNSTNETWKAEAESFIAWRDAVYAYALEVLNGVQQGGQPPELNDFMSGMPAMAWPN